MPLTKWIYLVSISFKDKYDSAIQNKKLGSKLT